MARTNEPIAYSQDASFSLKDHLFNREKILMMASDLKEVCDRFDDQQFVEQVTRAFPDLELKQRISHITDCLYTFLPQDYPQALDIIIRALPEPLDPNLDDDDFGDFVYEPYNEYIARYGLADKYLSISLKALEQTTQRFSAEFAIRKFITQFPDETLRQMIEWSVHPNYHVRRLASEGSRPNLPWGGKIEIDQAIRAQILDNLYCDRTRYVVRSVANQINDLSKTDLDWVLSTLTRWNQSRAQDQKEMNWLMRHALRTAIKQGDRQALESLGYRADIQYTIQNITYTQVVTIGQALEFSFDFVPEQEGQVMIDYVVYFLKKDGTNSQKTFKIKDVYLEPGKQLVINKKHPFRLMSTKKLYPGTHRFALQINGVVQQEHQFDLFV